MFIILHDIGNDPAIVNTEHINCITQRDNLHDYVAVRMTNGLTLYVLETFERVLEKIEGVVE